MAKRSSKKRRQATEAKPPAAAPAPWRVLMTDSAAAVYEDMYRRAREAENRGDPTNAHCTNFNMVREAVRTIIPNDPINRRNALTGKLSNVFRLHKGRMRILWIASSDLREIVILYISETLRKQGDVNDPYQIFTKMVMSGEFMDWFDRLGVKKPPRSMTPAQVAIQ